jgi:AcrR family transcriptional regulator
MYLQCSTAKTANQQKLFENALISLMQSEDFEKISVVDICERASITRRIFYRLFETKYDCLVAAIDHKMMESELYQSKEGRNGFSQILEYIMVEKDFFVALAKGNHMGLFMERLLAYMDSENSRAKQLMGIFSDEARELLIYNISGFIGVIFYWIDTDFACSIEEMARILTKIMRRQYSEPVSSVL